jgi:hypothetical protein
MIDKRRVISLSLSLAVLAMSSPPADAAESALNPLLFDAARYTTLSVTVDGAPMEVRHYRVVYVARPVRMAALQPGGGMPGPGGPPGAAPPTDVPLADVYSYQSMNIYVPASAYNNSKTAIILQVNNGGWRTSPAADRVINGGSYLSSSDTDNVGAALKAGYVLVNAGTRSRGAKAADGSWAGKSPAVIVDAKSAVRYLRFNDERMPGSAERIVITGTSGGGGLSVAVAASGNSSDYYPHLAEIGAAGIDANGVSTIRDDVFATVAYCPITDLGNADIAYEWQYNAVRTAANTARGEYPDAMRSASALLAAAYPAYLRGLGLKREDGTVLTADNMDDAIIAQVKREAEEVLAEGVAIPAIGQDFVIDGRGGAMRLANDWLTVENGIVTSVHYANYLRFVTRVSALKSVPAFDATAVAGNRSVIGENTLFGPANIEYFNFTQFAWDNNEVKGDGTGRDDTGKRWAAYVADPATKLDEQIKLANPMPYLNSSADSAPYWYVRHGMLDRDTSFAVEIALYHAIRNDPSVRDVDFELAWLKGHAGNYDVREAYAWLAGAIATAGNP